MEDGKVKTEIKPQVGFQEKATDCDADIAIIGGSAGCGKTFCLLYEPLRYVVDTSPGFKGIIFRRESVQIRTTGGLWDQGKDLYRKLPKHKRPKFRGGTSDFKFSFPGGSDLQLSHLHEEDSVYGYQGAEIPFIGFDELTHFTEEQFFYMLSRNRSGSCEVEPFVRASTNPQGEGWVKRLIAPWIYPDDYEVESLRGAPITEMQGVKLYLARYDKQTILKATPEEVLESLPEEVRGDMGPEAIRSITFVAGRLFENDILMKSNPGYLGNLLGLSETEREQLLNGRWINLNDDSNRLYSNQGIADIFSNTFVQKTGVRYITADIALEGNDKFVIAIWDGWVLVELREFDKSMGDQVLIEIQKAAKDWGVPVRRICFDSGGVGGYLKGFLRTAYPFVGGGSPIVEQKVSRIHGKNAVSRPQYLNLRAQCFYLLRDEIENCSIFADIPGDFHLAIEQELRAIKKPETSSDGKLRIIKKELIKKAIGRSPDFADVISMRTVFELLPRAVKVERKVTTV